MAKIIHNGMRKAVKAAAQKAGADRSASVKMHFNVLKKRVSQFKGSEEGRLIMCKAVEEYGERRAAEGKAEGIAEGIAKGERKGKRETMLAMAKRLLANRKLMLKEIAECTGLSLAQVKKLQASMA